MKRLNMKFVLSHIWTRFQTDNILKFKLNWQVVSEMFEIIIENVKARLMIIARAIGILLAHP